MRGRAWGSALVICAAMASIGRASADENESAAAALKKFELGREAFDAGKFDEAVAAFWDSYRLQGSPNSRLYIARCYARLGRVASAYINFRLTAREANDRLVATGEKRYGLTRDAATAEEGDLEPNVARLTLAVPGGMPVSFVLKLNGRPVAREAWGTAVETDAGHFVVEATGPRIRAFREEFDLKDGVQRRVDVRAVRAPTAIVAFEFRALPMGLAVEMDGEPVDVLDLDRPREVDVGAHVIVARAPGYAPFQWRKELADGQREDVVVDLGAEARVAPPKGTPPWLFFGAAGVAVTTLGAATYLALHAKSLSDSEVLKTPFLRDPAARDTVGSESTAANVLFVTGTVFAAGAAVLAFTTSWRSGGAAPTTFAIGPWLTPAGLGAGAQGRF